MFLFITYLNIFITEKLHHPLSLDVFENNLYWTNRDLGEVVKQDKFGRGLAVVLVRNLINPTGVKSKNIIKRVKILSKKNLCCLSLDIYKC